MGRNRKRRKTTQPSRELPDKIILGWWDGEPIWRYKTAQEAFAEQIDKAFAGNETLAINLT